MLQTAKGKTEEELSTKVELQCKDLFYEWLFDLNQEERQVWLWNAMVEMKRIKHRRK